MSNTISNVIANPSAIVDLYAETGIAIGTRLDIEIIGTSSAKLYSGPLLNGEPDNDTGYFVIKEGKKLVSYSGEQGLFLWARHGCTVSISESDYEPAPVGLYTGTRAITIQDYREANVKKGLEYEGSVLFSLAGGASSNTIFLTGDLDVSLKARVINYSGDGIKADIFELPTYTGGTAVAYQNANSYATPPAGSIPPAVGLVQILSGATITDNGVLKFAPVYGLGNTSNQGKGATNQTLGNEHILKSNTAYLLRITSLDDQAQSVASFLSWYEGELDLYPA